MKYIFSLLLLSLIISSFLMQTNSVYAQESTDNSNSVLERVKERVETLKKNPKAFIGIITDKTDTSFQLKGLQGKIELVSINDATHYVKIGTSESEIKFTDIAIGDFIAALGTLGDAQVLNARRIILSNPQADSRQIISGVISSISKRTLIVDTDDKQYTLTFPPKWNGPEIKALSSGNRVIIVAISDSQKLNIRTIDVIRI